MRWQTISLADCEKCVCGKWTQRDDEGDALAVCKSNDYKEHFPPYSNEKDTFPQPVFIFKFLSKAAIKLSAVVQTEMSKREEDGLGQKAKREKPRLGQRQEVWNGMKNISAKCVSRKIRSRSGVLLMDFPCQLKGKQGRNHWKAWNSCWIICVVAFT